MGPSGALARAQSFWPRLRARWMVSAGLLLAACGGSSPAVESPASRPPLPADIVEQSALPLHALRSADAKHAAGDGTATANAAPREKLVEPALWEELARARVICFGEQHDKPEHHYAQHRALVELATRSAAKGGTLAAGFEMFQRPYQAALTSFVAGSLPEEQFLAESEYDKRWGFDFALYRPLLKAVREFSLPALALNAPRELTRKIARGGLDGLDSGERRRLPELVLDDAVHRDYFDTAMGDHPMPPGAPSVDDMYAAQVVWDETMAETAAEWLSRSGDRAQLILFAGSGHCHRSAVPQRITRRSGIPVLSVLPVFASELARERERSGYDWLIVLED